MLIRDVPTIAALLLEAKSLPTLSDGEEWALKIIEVYMTWYAYFMGSNTIVLGWIFGTKIDESVKPMLPPICGLFIILNVLGMISTMAVAFTVKAPAPPEFHPLI